MMKKELESLKKSLEDRLEAESRKIESAENYSTKIVSMLGDVCKRVIRLDERVSKLERKVNVRG